MHSISAKYYSSTVLTVDVQCSLQFVNQRIRLKVTCMMN